MNYEAIQAAGVHGFWCGFATGVVALACLLVGVLYWIARQPYKPPVMPPLEAEAWKR